MESTFCRQLTKHQWQTSLICSPVGKTGHELCKYVHNNLNVTVGDSVLKSSHLTLPKSAGDVKPIALSSACIAVAASLRATRCCLGFLALGSVVPELLDLRLLLVFEISACNSAIYRRSKLSERLLACLQDIGYSAYPSIPQSELACHPAYPTAVGTSLSVLR